MMALPQALPSGGADNPIDPDNGGDPFIAEELGEYYYTYTTGGGIILKHIASFCDTTVLESKTVYSAGKDGIVGDIWAPEFHRINGRWYIIASAMFDSNRVEAGIMPREPDSSGDDRYRFGFVLENVGGGIFGDYIYRGRLAPGGLSNIDGTYLQRGSALYFVFSGYVGQGWQCIYIVPMENPFTVKNGAAPVMLSEPQYRWEQHGWRVNEGPAVLEHGGSVYIVYSASGFSSGYYALGMLAFKGGSPLCKANWYKSPLPVFSQNPAEKIYNTGHCNFIAVGTQVYMVYHASRTPSLADSPRATHIQKICFSGDIPVFQKPSRAFNFDKPAA